MPASEIDLVKDMNIRKKILSQKGFTLIETIAVLILVGIIVVFAGMGITSVIQGYLLTKMNAETTQKGQVTLTRLVKEFTVISSVDSGASSATSITFTSYKQGVAGTHVVSWVGDNLLLDGDILTDHVSGFDLGYYDSYNGTKQSTWTSTRKMIEITLSIRGANDVISVFTDRVAPRNL